MSNGFRPQFAIQFSKLVKISGKARKRGGESDLEAPSFTV
jgi:hypothetical protein